MGDTSRGHALGFMPGLDGIRAIAVILVFAFHAKVPGFTGAYIGVDVFFVLSGFLISTLLLQEIDATGTVAIRAFWRRRMVRLLPALATLVVAFLCVTPLLSEPPKAPLLQSVASLLYFSDYLRAFTKVPDYLGHTWSLAVEAKFYLIWPLVLIFCATRMAPEALWKTILLLAIFATSWRLLNVQLTTWDLVYFRADTRISGLLLGSALAAATRAGIRPKLPVWMGFLPLILLPLLSREYYDVEMLLWVPLLFELATALLILVVLQGNGLVARMLALRPIVWLGSLSYSLYLWHYPIMRVLRDEMHWTSSLLVGVPLSVGLAWVSLQTVERWALRFRYASAPAAASG